jgi:hypothetical protein
MAPIVTSAEIGRPAHWDAAYARGDDTRSWFEDHPRVSLRMLGARNPAPV